MNITGISSTATTEPSGFAKKMAQGKKDFLAMEEALKSGDLEAAKSAFETIENNRPNPPSGMAEGSFAGGKSGKNGPESDFASLENALNSGDVQAAQKAFETIQTHMKKGHSGSQIQSSTSVASKSVSSDGVGELLDLVA